MARIVKRGAGFMAVGVLLCFAWPAQAQLTGRQKCEIKKNRAVAKRVQCAAVQRVREIKGLVPDYAGCSTRMIDTFDRAESQAFNDGGCPSTGDALTVEARIDSVFNPADAIPKGLSGPRFLDNGNQTITDISTGLQWEKKDNINGSFYYVGSTWQYSTNGATPDGDLFLTLLNFAANSCTSSAGVTVVGGLGGHCDWRLPTVTELEGIRQTPCTTGPCIDPVFGPTQSAGYWAQTEGVGGNFVVDFASSAVATRPKTSPYAVRLVRGTGQ